MRRFLLGALAALLGFSGPVLADSTVPSLSSATTLSGASVYVANGLGASTDAKASLNTTTFGLSAGAIIINPNGIAIGSQVSGLGSNVGTALGNTLNSSTGVIGDLTATNNNCVVGNGTTWTSTTCPGGGSSTGFGVDGGTASVTLTASCTLGTTAACSSHSIRLVKIGTLTGAVTFTLDAIANVSTDTCVRFEDAGSNVSGTDTVTFTANAADAINGGSAGGSTSAFTTAGLGVAFCVSATHNWNIFTGATIAASSPSQVAIGVNQNGLVFDAATSLSAGSGALSLGSSGTAGSVAMGNATSGTVTLQPVTGALGAVTASLPANTGTISELNINQAWTAGQAVTPDTSASCGTISTGGTATPNFANSNSCQLTFGTGASATMTVANPTNIKIGQDYLITVAQNTSGSGTVSWGTDFDWGTAGAPTLTTAASKIDEVMCYAYAASGANSLHCRLAGAGF